MTEHYLHPGDYVTCAGFHYAHVIETVSALAVSRGNDPHVAVERQLNQFGPDVSIAFVSPTPFIMSDDKISSAARAAEDAANKASATILNDGDEVRLENKSYTVKIHGERFSDPIAFKRNWPKASREDVEKLKLDWLSDPHWDLGGEDGFEHHYSELVSFREETDARHKAKIAADHEARIAKLDAAAGLGGNRALAEYIIGLEDKIASVDSYYFDRMREMEPA